MSRDRLPPPQPESCLTSSRASRYKGGTLVRSLQEPGFGTNHYLAVTDLQAEIAYRFALSCGKSQRIKDAAPVRARPCKEKCWRNQPPYFTPQP